MAVTNDQVRRLTNRVHLAGMVTHFEGVREGVYGEKKIPYLAFRGTIQCGETPEYSMRFETFISSKKQDGSASPNFIKVKDWASTVIAADDNRVITGQAQATMVDMVGSMSDHAYVNKNGELREDVTYNMTFFNPFREYAAEVDAEGYIAELREEVSGESEVPTGRMIMRLITRDYKSMINLKNIIIPAEKVEAIKDNDYEVGATATFYLSYHSVPSEQMETKGIGITRGHHAGNRLELVVDGADLPLSSDSEKALKADTIKAAMLEYKRIHDDIKAAGYKGKSNNTLTGSTRSTIGASRDVMKSNPIDDDDMPF